MRTYKLIMRGPLTRGHLKIPTRRIGPVPEWETEEARDRAPSSRPNAVYNIL